MTSAIPLNTSNVGTGVELAAPPWHLIHFHVHCARCGHDLCGQVEPVCPACRLEFSWSDAAPLEQLTCGKCNYHLYGLADPRCPECGTAVDWNAALLRYRRRKKPLFEYCWRDRSMRSFFHTWFLALRPGKLWRIIDIHDPPMLLPLSIWASTIFAFTALSFPVGQGATRWWLSFQSGGAAWRPTTLLDLPTFVVPNLSYLPGYLPALMLALYAFFAFAALMIFQQSMAKCKVRKAHVARVTCMSTVAVFPVAALAYLIMDYQIRYVPSYFKWYRGIEFSTLWVFIQPFFWLGFVALPASFTLGIAYRRYIRMPHSFGVGIASQAIALLSVAALFSVLARLSLINL